MNLQKRAIKLLGQSIHHRKKLSPEQKEALTEYVDNAREVFAELRVHVPETTIDQRTGNELDNEETNRRLYNIIRNKDDKALKESVEIMSKGTTRTPFLKQLEELGVQVSKSIKRSILKNSIDKNQNFQKLPKAYRHAGADIIDPTLPNRNEMWSEIWGYWQAIRGNSKDTHLVVGIKQRLEIDAMLKDLLNFTYAELAHFYTVYYESGDLFLDLINNYDSAGGGIGSLYTKGMVSIRRKINASKGKGVGDIPNYSPNNEGVWDDFVDTGTYYDYLVSMEIDPSAQ